MLPEQKRAWFVVVVSAVVVGGVAALAPFGGARALGVLGLFGLVGLTPLLFRAKPKPGQVASDERDQEILLKATVGGFATSYLWFVLGCMAVWFFCMWRGQKMVRIDVLPFLVVVGAVALMVTRAVGTLLAYRGHGADGEN